ncbi:dynein regulatory complex subunit 2 [Sebastes fasciatus]|uniref:dynein regulatory complex subunit 2 n=1 Tax=Sebastes fasciatus TaxID=394691 RepID=UPI003D9E964A
MPKKAKKGGGGGGGKTEEERLMFLQQRAQAEEEMAKKREEILTLFLKDKLQKEERNTAVNLLKLNEGWRSILRQTRAGELRGDLAVLSQTFERQLDGLDSVVKNLERDLREAERQSAQVRRIHLQHVERLWDRQGKRLALVQRRWENGLQHLSSGFNSERKQMSSRSQQQRDDLEDATFTVEQRHKTVMEEIQDLYWKTIKAYESAHADRKAALVLEDKVKLKVKSVQKQDAVQLCSKETKELSQLLDTTQRLVQRTDADVKNVKRLQDAVIQLRAALTSSKTEDVLVDQDLTAARNQVNRKTHALRDQLTQAHTAARKQLTELTVQSDAAAKKLQAVIAKGQRVLRVADMCHKLESVSSSFPSEDQRPETTGPETETTGPETEKTGPETETTGSETKEPVKEFSELQQVTRSINTCVLQREALRRQRDDLNRENQQLRLLLRQHLDAMTVGEHDLDGRHALLTAYRAPTTSVPADTGRRHNVIEAAHIVKHSL